MPFPLVAAMIGSAIIGGGTSMIAANKAAGAAKDATTANNVLAREQYGQNSANLQPYIQSGYSANDALSRQLRQSGPDWNAYGQQNPDAMENAQREVEAGTFPSVEASLENHYQQFGQAEGRPVPKFQGAEPEVAPRQTYTRQTDPGRDTYTRPDFARPEGDGFKFGMDEYVQTPGFNFQQERGMGALKSDKTLSGLLRSGSAVKSALDFSQNLAMQDFTGERNFAYGQFSDDRARRDNNFSQDRAYGANAFESDRGYGADVYGQDRQNRNNIFADDRAFGTGIYDADRGYAANRYDTRTNNLLNISGQGMAGVSALAGVGQNYLSNVSSNNNTQAGITANAALMGAGQVNNLLGDAAYAYGRRGTSYSGTKPSAGTTYDWMTPANRTTMGY